MLMMMNINIIGIVFVNGNEIKQNTNSYIKSNDIPIPKQNNDSYIKVKINKNYYL